MLGREDAGTPLGKTMPGTKLALMEQTFKLAGEEYRLVVPSDTDAVIDHCLAAGAPSFELCVIANGPCKTDGHCGFRDCCI